MEKNEEYICPVCGKYYFEEYASFDECPICGWTDDFMQRQNPDWDGCANDMSLNQAKQAYKEGRRVE